MTLQDIIRAERDSVIANVNVPGASVGADEATIDLT
jgi:hypothetical protein